MFITCLEDAVEMVRLCPLPYVNMDDDGCKNCPLKEVDDIDMAICEHIRAAGMLVGDTSFV